MDAIARYLPRQMRGFGGGVALGAAAVVVAVGLSRTVQGLVAQGAAAVAGVAAKVGLGAK